MVLAAQLGGLTLAVALPEVVLSVDSSQEPLSTDPDPSPPAPKVDEAPQDVGSILNPYRRPELPKEPRLVSSASVAEFKKLKQAGKLSKPTLAPVAEAQSASGDAMTLANAEIMVSNRLPFLSRKTVGRQSPMKSRPHRRLREIRSNPKFRRPNLSSKRVWMRMSLMGLDLWVYWIWLPARKKDMQEQRFLITNRRRHQNTVHRVGRRRWKIEALFKTLKSRFALGKFGQKTKQGVLRFLCLSFACFLLCHLEFISQQESGSAIAEPDWGELAKRVRYKLFGWVRLIELEHERLEILAVLDEEKWVAA